jgi:hypothetical protein
MIVSPVSAGLCDGLEAAVDGDEPPQAATSVIDAAAIAIKRFARTQPYTEPGYVGNSYSAVT